MSLRTLQRWAVAVAMILAVISCGPKLTPEQRLEKLRLKHDIFPLGTNTVTTVEGETLLLVDMQVTNHGTECLPHLTVLVRVRGADGVEKVAERITLDLSRVRPGVGVQMDAQVRGVELDEKDEVLLELESNLPPEVLHQLPEWEDLMGAGG